MTNHFEDDDAYYLVLRNDEGQHSLWPAASDVPVGWVIAKHADNRAACLEFVEQHWTDMRPKSLAVAMNDAAQQ
ncbi:MbtH family NRPS accessory protein [Streptomyces sp. P17]|uniref:MbtH family protein n=1 Tax=Streptomyces sp. P17 TaxID=3074716 RepID=UPI0028F459D9|nr:MbtH family NRPS accessory protein [Streptomyces sp. P17]MDT9701829.1 MbtH family NRPS accessory protein [Streptomyces sp. P17]